MRRLLSSTGFALGVCGLALAAAVVFYQACAVYNPSLLLPEAGASDAGSDSACDHAYYPDRPAQDGPSQLNVEVVLAVQSIDFGLAPDAGMALAPYGFDLDHVCTCPGPPSCAQADGATETCDDQRGRDHAALELFRELGPLAPSGNGEVNTGFQAGQYGLLFHLRNYNGLANDKQVSVAVYASNGVSGIEDGGTPDPHHDGTDKWTIDPGYLVQGSKLVGMSCEPNQATCTPLYVDDNAYVANDVLVAKVDFPVSFGTSSFLGGAVMSLRGSVIVGTLSPMPIPGGGLSYRITEGTIAGRWPTSALLQTLAAIPDNVTGTAPYLCGNDLGYLLLKSAVCQIADITSDLTLDGTGAPCDAVSIGFRFDAEPARLGVVYGVPPAPAGCMTDGGFPFTDSCFPH
ncbi:MAG TPA: hypothetical protein VKU41_25545 [Polyangiaceae bacterium]|nr:hypothetical protein [Polyangiaceae bacterium]